MLPHVPDIDAVQDVNGSPVLREACSAWALPVDNTSHVPKRSEEASVLSPSFSRRCRVAGFTFIEMMIVFVILGIMTTMMVRAVRGQWLGSARRSATRDIGAYLFRGRGIAVQQSRTAWVVRTGDVLKILVDSSGTPVQLGSQLDFFQRYGAHLAATPKDTVQFDQRGFAPYVTLIPRFIISLGGRTDTVCVTGLGKITSRSC